VDKLSAFRTREDPRPTSEFDAACPCPDGLMQDETEREDECWGPSAYEGPQKQDLTVFLEYNV
jgi:hypothetical protein